MIRGVGEGDISVPGSDLTRMPPPPVISLLKNCWRYVRSTMMS